MNLSGWVNKYLIIKSIIFWINPFSIYILPIILHRIILFKIFKYTSEKYVIIDSHIDFSFNLFYQV